MAAGTKSRDRLKASTQAFIEALDRLGDALLRSIVLDADAAMMMPTGLLCPLCEQPLDWNDSIRAVELPRFGAGVLVTIHAHCR